MYKIKNLTIFLKFTKFLVFIFIFNFAFFSHLSAQEATGGDNVYEIEIADKLYRVHEFTTVGNHQFIANKDLEVDVLVVAGGGGAAANMYSAGGGGGGLIFEENYLIQGSENVMIEVGAGGNINSPIGDNGESSIFGDLIAIGGGGGSASWNIGPNDGGANGGSGGGGHYVNPPGQGINGQGYSGGSAYYANGNRYSSGGGGGAGGKGGDGSSTYGGTGGAGREIWGVWYAGGGSGAGVYALSNGITRYEYPGTNGQGQENPGGGGQGHAYRQIGDPGKNGIIILRYEIIPYNLNFNNSSADITPTKTSPQFTISGTLDYPDDGDATSVAVSATIGGISRSVNVPVGTNMTWQLSWNFNDLTEGEYTDIEFTATSNSSTPEETTSTYTGKIIIDKTPPTCGTWSPNESPWKVSGGETFTLASSSDTGGSGLATASASVSCSTGPLYGDTCPVTIFDKAGNDKICPSPINRVDIFAPNLTVTPAITGWQGDKQDIIVLSEDNETNLARIAYAWDLNTLGADCSGGTTISSGDNLRLTISGGANPLYVCSIDIAGNVSTFTNIYQYIPPVFANPTVDKNVKPANLYWNIQSVSEAQSYVEIKGFFPKTTGNYYYALEYIIPTINKSYTQALRTSPFTETHFTFLIPTTDFRASKDNHTFSGPQKLKITDLDQMEATTIDHNLSFFFPIHQSNHRKDFNYFIFASDSRLNEVE